MITEVSQHKGEYFFLFLYTALSFIFILGFSQNIQKFVVVTLYGGYYFSWSLMHHLINKNLNVMVFLEYLLITFLALVILKVVFFTTL